MKVGILTLPFNPNYGGILQGYALQTAIERLGHEAYHINRASRFCLPFYLRPIAYAKRLVEQKVQGKNKRILFEEYQNAIAVNTNRFVEQHLHLWRDGMVNSVLPTDFDALVVGSDQVWRREFWPHINDAFLGFAEGWPVKRVAYAASFGTDRWAYSQRESQSCGTLLSHFNGVSVRESSAIALCREHLGCDAVQMPDPTLLLQRQDYDSLTALGGLPAKKSASLFVYLLNKNSHSDTIINAVAHHSGLTPHSIVATDDIHLPVSECVRPGVETWLRGFAESSMVLTNSFHGCIFSIIFGKPFVVVGKRVAGLTRIQSLLDLFGFEGTYIDEDANHLEDIPVMQTDTPQVTARLEELRNKGYDFLSQNL